MVTKIIKIKSPKDVGAQLKGTVKDSAQQIWQAGLGAITRAQAEGTKAVESLVKESISIQRKTQAAAEGKLTEATHKVSSMATDISSKASGQWDKLESIFEERVAKALKKLGVPTASEVDALHARIDALSKVAPKSSRTTAARKPATTKASAPKTKAKAASKGASK
jgi:poly(hydroxyalkanoate) granule-associated protein